jgi:cyclic pyranopterin phosphate synthase
MLNHFDMEGKAVMADVSAKEQTHRTAVAKGRICMRLETLDMICSGGAQKGDVLGVARIAGINAAKAAGSMIPLCHTVLLDSCRVDFQIDRQAGAVEAICTVKSTGRTGVEMEALTGASLALLTIYDMCKAVERSMTITDICLCEKSGGKSGVYKKED